MGEGRFFYEIVEEKLADISKQTYGIVYESLNEEWIDYKVKISWKLFS